MITFRYNGIEFPALPERDVEQYPHAYIVNYTGSTFDVDYMLFFTDDRLGMSNDTHITAVVGHATDGQRYDYINGEWVYYGYWGVTHGHSSWQSVPIWSNTDVLYNANGSLYLAASDPVPVGDEHDARLKALYYSKGGDWYRMHRKNADGWKAIDVAFGTPSKVAEFNQLDGVRFIYFTDPHLSEGLGWESDFHKYMAKVKQAFDASGCELVICGGDWMGNSDTKEQAIAKLTYIKSYMGKLFGGKALMVLGNHDTNYQGEVQLSRDEVNELWFKDTNTGKAYYYVDTDTARFIVLDTQTDWAAGWSDYFLEQYNWLAANLSEDKLNVVVPHIIWVDSERTTRTALADVVRVMGGVSLVLGGHLHEDYVENGDVPEVLTTDMRAGGTPTFDLCALNNTKLTMLRVGSGKNRTIDLGGA